MHYLIEEVIADIEVQVKNLKCDINFKLLDNDGYLLANQNNNKVAAIGIIVIKDEKGHQQKVVGAFSINVKKYAWAEAEGFTQEEMIDQLNDEIFQLMGLDDVVHYLCSDEIYPYFNKKLPSD